ncbi:hypothetical protein Van01_47570 [Micromonospora andamanensis]|uniref:Uncharacterized protein n=1 Tax=Micromonospora andamanensis TaxID=1287068 RepID=A0ABQ4I0Z3_9ACTN|nr:hypothetical protein Van01_47570 [Micromonospora andamanensis]
MENLAMCRVTVSTCGFIDQKSSNIDGVNNPPLLLAGTIAAIRQWHRAASRSGGLPNRRWSDYIVSYPWERSRS